MLRVTTANARAGMVLALPVHHPVRAGHLLLKPGAVLDAKALEKLQEFKVGTLWIRYPALDYLARYISPQISAAQARLAGALSQSFDTAASGGHAALDFPVYAHAVGSLLKELIERPDACVLLNDLVVPDSPMLSHATTTCFLSLLLGLKLDAYLIAERAAAGPTRAKRVENLGVGALLHDIGMLKLSPEAQARWLAAGDESDPEWRLHVRHGFEMLRGKVAPTAAAVALHHHQRFDGTGFPMLRRLSGGAAPLAGRRIHVFSRIVSVAELFDRLRNPPGAATPLPAVGALRRLLAMAREGTIDPVVFRGLLTVAPAYPPGAVVRLSDGRTAVVDGWSPTEPCRPRVREVVDLAAGKLKKAEDLRATPGVTVAEVDGIDVRAENFYAAREISRRGSPARAPQEGVTDILGGSSGGSEAVSAA